MSHTEVERDRPASEHLADERLANRELRSSRATASVIAAVLIALAGLYLLLEAALKAIGQPSWLADPEEMAGWLNQLPGNVAPAVLAASGALILLLGLFFFLQGVLPGHLHRHRIPGRRGVVVVDDEVLASSLARRARTEAQVTREQVLVVVSRSLVDVRLRPTSGIPVNADAIQLAVEDEVRRARISPVPQVRVFVSSSGVVGQ
ncbi:hypothetical protein ACWF5H_00180 [Arthrobacter sp. NPDC055138]